MYKAKLTSQVNTAWYTAIIVNMYKIHIILQLTCPAVSHICNFIFCPETSIMRVPNSTPMVWGQSAMTKTNKTNTNINKSRSKQNNVLTLFLSKLMKETWFSNPHVSYYDVFEDVGIVVRTSRHFACKQNKWVGQIVQLYSNELSRFYFLRVALRFTCND